MITPIFVPISQSRPSFEERLNSATLDYSDKPTEQKAFKDGANWAHGADGSTLAFAFLLVLFLVGMLQISSGVIGLMDGTDPYDKAITNKWKYALPLYNPCFKFSRWMSKEKE